MTRNAVSLQTRRINKQIIMANNSFPGLILGIDIGGTSTTYGLVSPEGGIIACGNIPTTGYRTFTDFIQALYRSVQELMASEGLASESVSAIGVGAPCVNSEAGEIQGAVNLPWPSPLPLVKELKEVFHRPAAAENDANAAALGEMYYGAGKGLDNFIMITLGTGVGAAVVCDGRLLRGKNGLAGELGHCRIVRGPEARRCNCGRYGCLDAYLTARGIPATARELLDKSSEPSILRGIDTLDAKQIGDAAAAGDPIALETMRKTGEILGEACAEFTCFSSPKAFIFFGGIARSYPYFEKAMRESFRKNLLWIYEGQVDFFPALLPEADAAILGAAAVARDKILKPNP